MKHSILFFKHIRRKKAKFMKLVTYDTIRTLKIDERRKGRKKGRKEDMDSSFAERGGLGWRVNG